MPNTSDVAWELTKALVTGGVGILIGRWTARTNAGDSAHAAFEGLRNMALHERVSNQFPVRLKALRDFMATRPKMLAIEANRRFWDEFLEDAPVILGFPAVDVHWDMAKTSLLHEGLRALKFK